MNKLLLATLAATALECAAVQEAPLWLRDVAISPDGKTVAFTYQGDIFTVPVSGGLARQLTSNAAYDSSPRWSPDGLRIAFASDRNGSDDIFVMPAVGGTPVRITTNSAAETPLTWLDAHTVLYSSNIAPGMQAAQGPFQGQTYTVDVDRSGARPQLYLSVHMNAADAASDGAVLYQDRKGYENVWRKHERSSGTADIWRVKNGTFTKLTGFNGHDLNPVFAPGESGDFYFISEQDGTLNVWRADKDGKNQKQVSHFTTHPVRSLSVADNGMLAYSWNGEIYTQKEGGEPVKLSVQIAADLYDADEVAGTRSTGARSWAVSPSGEEVAFVLRGDVYVTSVKYKTTRRITDTSAQERNVAFSPDGKTLVYDSDRNGLWQLFTSKIVSPDDKLFTYAAEIEEEPLYSCETAAQQPEFSPDGKKVAFLENRTELKVIDLKTKKVNTALDGKWNYSYSDGDVSYAWSPDSRWFLTSYIGDGGWNNTDIALVAADGSELIDLTESGYSDGEPRWALDGKGVAYVSGRYGMRSHGSWGETDDVLLMVLDPQAWEDFNMTEEEAALKEKETDKDKDTKEAKDKSDKKKGKKGKKDSKAEDAEKDVKPLKFDLANRRYRTARLTPQASNLQDYYISPKGDKLYYTAGSTEGKSNLFVRDLRDGSTKVLVKDVRGGIMADKKGENLFVAGNGLKKVKIPSGDVQNIEFEADYDRKPSAEREYMYNHMWKQVKDKFYDANLHGVDWEMYGENYRKFLPYISNNRDFAILLSEILGELNASHTGGRYSAPGAKMPVASLGAYFDENYTGDGLKVSEVLPRGPLTAASVDVQPGDVIMAIDGNSIEAGKDYFPLLAGKASKKVRLTVQKPGGKTVSVQVKPISAGEQNGLLYERWVEKNEAYVDSISGGRVGYVHIQGMNSPSFRNAYERILGKYRNCDAVVVDTRHNGGGWLHNDLAILLSGKEYVRFTPRGQYIGSEPFSQWTKPSAMLVDESNYSDAHGSPFVYQTLGIGDIVGAPVPGTMTAVWWETQIDPSIVFGIPQVTSQAMDGTVLENHQLNPDILIYNEPADVLSGHDSQLEGAVRSLLKKVSEKK